MSSNLGQAMAQIGCETIAKVCHEVNRAYCNSIGDQSQKAWGEAEPWQRDSAIKGVLFALHHPDATPKDQHEAWMKEKLSQGWEYGPQKSVEHLTHPCLVDYEQLPKEQRVKDALFIAVVHAFLP